VRQLIQAWTAIVIAALLLAACASRPQLPPPTLPSLQLPPAALGTSLSLTQRLTVTRAPSAAEAYMSMPTTHSLDVLLEIDSAAVHLAGFALGQRVLTLAWDGQTLESTRHPMLPAAVDAAKVLRDVQLVYWPAASVQAALPDGWTLEDAGTDRRLSHDGKLAATIHYETEPRWAGNARLDNRLEDYHLLIESKVQAQ